MYGIPNFFGFGSGLEGHPSPPPSPSSQAWQVTPYASNSSRTNNTPISETLIPEKTFSSTSSTTFSSQINSNGTSTLNVQIQNTQALSTTSTEKTTDGFAKKMLDTGRRVVSSAKNSLMSASQLPTTLESTANTANVALANVAAASASAVGVLSTIRESVERAEHSANELHQQTKQTMSVVNGAITNASETLGNLTVQSTKVLDTTHHVANDFRRYLKISLYASGILFGTALHYAPAILTKLSDQPSPFSKKIVRPTVEWLGIAIAGISAIKLTLQFVNRHLQT